MYMYDSNYLIVLHACLCRDVLIRLLVNEAVFLLAMLHLREERGTDKRDKSGVSTDSENDTFLF